MDDCIFCEILSGDSPASVVLRNDHCTGFMDVQPINPGHVLVVPNGHAGSLANLPEGAGAHLFTVAQRVAAALYGSGFRCEGVNLFLADGEAAGQEVFHVNLHVIPRFEEDGFGLVFGPHYDDKPGQEELKTTAKSVQNALRTDQGPP